MNISTNSTPDLEAIRKAVQEFRPNPRRIPFSALKPLHDSIVELHDKGASYAVIAELLQQHGIKTSRARVAEYGRIVLDGGRSRKRRKRAKPVPIVVTSVTAQNVPTVITKPMGTSPPLGNISPLQKETSGSVSRGPRIAHVKQMSPEEAAEFQASLKARNTSKP